MTTEISILLSAKDQTKAAFSSMNRSVDEAREGFGRLQGLFAAGFAGITIGGTFSKFIAETKAAEQEQAQLAAVLRSTGEAAGWSQEKLNEMAASLARSSTYSEGDINNAQTRLLAYTDIVGKAVPETMQAIVDMSARTGQSLEQSAETLGKAINTPSAGMASLKRLGFDFGEEQIKAAKKLEAAGKTYEAQQIVLREMTTTYGGAAKAARDTFGGALTALQNNIDSLLTGDSGSMAQMKEAVEGLNKTLESDETRAAFQQFTGLLAQVSKGAVQAATDVMAFFNSGAKGRILGDYAMSEFGIGGRQKGRDLAYTNARAARADIVSAGQFLDDPKKSEAERANARKLRAEATAALAYWDAQMQREAAPKFADPRVLGDPGSIASQAAALFPGGGGGGGAASGSGGSKTKKDLEAEAKRAIESLEKQVEKTRELSEVEKQLEEIRRIRDGGGVVTEAQKQRMLQLAAEVDAGKERDERLKREEKEREAAQDRENKRWEEGQRLIESTRTPLEAYTAEVGRLNGLLKAGAIDQDTHTRALSQAWQQYDEGQKALKKLNDDTDEFSKRAAGNIQDQLGDGLYNILTGNFDDIGKAWGQMLARMVAEAAAAKLSRSMFGDLVEGGSGSGWAGSALKALGGALGLAGGAASSTAWSAATTAGMGNASAVLNIPKFDVGTNYVPEDMLAMIHKGEKIVPAKYNRAADPDAQSAAVAPMTFAPSISVDSRTDRAAILADMQNMLRNGFQQFAEQLKRTGVMPA